jgi:hypothetical protein
MNEVQDVYAAARDQLRQKIPGIVSLAEFDAFLTVGRSSSCTTDTHARDLLESIRSDAQYRSRFHKFFEAVHTLLEPLRLFKSAFDTLCQAEPTFCLVWGSVKVLIEVRKNTSVPPNTAVTSQTCISRVDRLTTMLPARQ